MKCKHALQDEEYVLRRLDSGEYFPLTRYTCSVCKEKVVSDGIWWAIQGIPSNVVFEPEPEKDKIIINFGFCKIKARKEKEGWNALPSV